MDIIKGDHATLEVFLKTASGDVYEVKPRTDLANHSLDGFSWGYTGSGPAQLAIGILALVTTDGEAREMYQSFKSDVIGRLLQHEDFVMTAESVRDWIRRARRARNMSWSEGDVEVESR